MCESGDWLGKDRLVRVPAEGDLFAVMDAGAYCMAMASNYNLRARPAEVMVEGTSARLIQARESYEDVVRKQFFVNSSSVSTAAIDIPSSGSVIVPGNSFPSCNSYAGSRVLNMDDEADSSSCSSSSTSSSLSDSTMRMEMPSAPHPRVLS